jgi:hypothetical protein
MSTRTFPHPQPHIPPIFPFLPLQRPGLLTSSSNPPTLSLSQLPLCLQLNPFYGTEQGREGPDVLIKGIRPDLGRF